jgi:hypothetical protein
MPWTNRDAIHRHACHALEDFEELRMYIPRSKSDLIHSLSHHLRHVVHRSSHEVEQPRVESVRRSSVCESHK